MGHPLGPKRDLRGLTVGLLTVQDRPAERKGEAGHWAWWCRCACGEKRLLHAARLIAGLQYSCGCEANALRGEAISRAMKGRPWSPKRRAAQRKRGRKP